MVRLRQTAVPGDRANWTEYLYSGELKVVNGETETDNPDWINFLKFKGFTVVEGDGEPVETVGEVRTEPAPEPQGTQVVTKDSEIPKAEEPAPKKAAPVKRGRGRPKKENS